MRLLIFHTIVFLFLCKNGEAQDSLSSNFASRKKILIAAAATGYSASIIGLNQTWYKNYPRSKFHFFDDNQEWLQMDKMGHIFTSYQLGRFGIESMQWAGYDSVSALWWGSSVGIIFLSTVEILDGFSSQWGFSMGDMGANLAGMMLALGQHAEWGEQRIQLKFSYQKNSFVNYRPEMFGSTLPENILKDYNGQTYWLSVNVPSFLPHKKYIPKWLNIALGYSAENMIGAENNDMFFEYACKNIDCSTIDLAGVNTNRYRQFFLSLDVNLTKIKTRSRFLKTLFSVVSMVKIPAPAIEWNTHGKPVFHGIYF